MAHFFTFIKKQLLNEGKIQGYLKYAIGEVLLVVIGILIALALNSSYETKQNNAFAKSILKQVQKELGVDIKDAIRITDSYIYTDSIVRLIFKDSISMKDYERNFNFYNSLGISYVSFTTNKAGYQQLVNSLTILPDSYKKLLPDLHLLHKEYQNDIDDFNSKFKSDAERQRLVYGEKFKDYYLWKLGVNTKEGAIQMFKDPLFKNVTMNHISNFKWLTGVSNKYRIKALEIYQKIDTLLGTPIDSLSAYQNFSQNYTKAMEPYLGKYGSDQLNDLALVAQNNQLVMQFIASASVREFPVWKHNDQLYFFQTGELSNFFTLKMIDSIPSMIPKDVASLDEIIISKQLE